MTLTREEIAQIIGASRETVTRLDALVDVAAHRGPHFKQLGPTRYKILL